MFNLSPHGTGYQNRPQGWMAFAMRGVPVYIENGFWLFLGAVWLWMLYRSESLADSVILCLVIFISLLGHEAGHAFAARYFRLSPVHISLVMFGGYARHPATARGHSLLITLAGPAVSFTLGVVGLFLLMGLMKMENGMLMNKFVFFCKLMFSLNLFWCVFNMLPIYPMDGGKACLYAFCYRCDDRQAMLKTAYVSLATIVVIALITLVSHWGNILILCFLSWFGLQNYQIIKSLRSPWG